MNNIQINSNNNENQPVKPSKKKQVLKVLLIVLICIWIGSTILQIAVGAEDITISTVSNTVYEPIEGTITASGTNVGTVGDCTYIPYNSADIPSDYYVSFNNVNINTQSNGTAFFIYLTVVIKNNVTPGWFVMSCDYELNINDGVYHRSIGKYYVDDEFTLLTFQMTSDNNINPNFNFMGINKFWSDMPDYTILGSFIGVNMEMISKNAINLIDTYNNSANPSSAVYGTDEVIISHPTNTSTMYYARGITFPWDSGFIGWVGRVKTADGVSVPVMYSIRVDGLLQEGSEGTLVILDPNYHDYIVPFEIYGGQQNPGYVDITVSNDMEILYIAVSDNYDLLAVDLVEKANEYQLIQDEINNAYLQGFQNGLAQGADSVKIGVFGNAEMQVEYRVTDNKLDTPYTETVIFPINVSAGGIDFTNVWDWYKNSVWWDSRYSLNSIEINIVFEDGFLWSNDILFWKLRGDNVTQNMLPYDTYLFTIEDSNQLFDIVYKYDNGKYYLTTETDLSGYSVSNVIFTINSQYIAYEDFFVTRSATLYNNITNWGTNQTSYNKGYKDGQTNGKLIGEEIGKEIGYVEGYEVAKYEYYEKGYDVGYREGNDVGYFNGRADGMNEEFNFYLIPTSIMDSYTETFFGLLDFTFFGVNMAGFFLQLATIVVVGFIWKKVK